MEEVFDWLQSQTPEPDIVQIKRHLQILSNQTYSDTESIISLELLTDLLHQIDNGVDFTKVNGIETLLDVYTNESKSLEVRGLAMGALGAACQNNPEVIHKCHDNNAVTNILFHLQMISPDSNEYNLTNPFVDQFATKSMFALSALTRQDIEGTNLMLQMNGDIILHNLFVKCDPHIPSQSHLANKILTYVTDVTALNANNIHFITTEWCNIMANYLKSDEFNERDYALRYFNAVMSKQTKQCKNNAGIMDKVKMNLNWIANDMTIEDDLDSEQQNDAKYVLQTIQSQKTEF